ncbi:MAG: transcription termination/antitermination factor NusG [Caldiserica bacterium]|nr:transcription termination/antitermination factor NusG [Caldisericota bacterium]
MAKNWYSLHILTGQEEKVRQEIEHRLKLEGMEDAVEEVLVPTEEVKEIKKGKSALRTQVIYKGYLFIKMENPAENKKLWYLIRRIPGVTGFVGGREPLAVSEEEIAKVKSLVEERKSKPRPTIVLEVGENVKIIEGPFTNFSGYIDEVDSDKGRVRVMVSIFGRSTPVELEYWQVEKI